MSVLPGSWPSVAKVTGRHWTQQVLWVSHPQAPAPLSWLPPAVSGKTFLLTLTDFEISIITFLIWMKWTSLREANNIDKKWVLKGNKKWNWDSGWGPCHFNTGSCGLKRWCSSAGVQSTWVHSEPTASWLDPRYQKGALICCFFLCLFPSANLGTEPRFDLITPTLGAVSPFHWTWILLLKKDPYSPRQTNPYLELTVPGSIPLNQPLNMVIKSDRPNRVLESLLCLVICIPHSTCISLIWDCLKYSSLLEASIMTYSNGGYKT